MKASGPLYIHHVALTTHHFPMPLLVFEFLGTTELLVIALVALIIFGPRKLPEIGRTIGKGMAEFKRASEDFKRTWEYEVEVEQRQAPAPEPAPEVTAERGLPPAEAEGASTDLAGWTPPAEAQAPEGETVARSASFDDAAPTPAATEESPERERV